MTPEQYAGTGLAVLVILLGSLGYVLMLWRLDGEALFLGAFIWSAFTFMAGLALFDGLIVPMVLGAA